MDVEDLSQVNLALDNGVYLSYQQCHFTPDYWRNYTVIGTHGRLENFGDAPGGVVKVWNARRSGYRADADLEMPIPPAEGGHGGADPRLVDEFLALPPRRRQHPHLTGRRPPGRRRRSRGHPVAAQRRHPGRRTAPRPSRRGALRLTPSPGLRRTEQGLRRTERLFSTPRISDGMCSVYRAGARSDSAGARSDSAGARSDSAGARPDSAGARSDSAGARPDSAGARSGSAGARSGSAVSVGLRVPVG